MQRIGVFEYLKIKVHYRINSVDERVLDHSFDNDIFFKEIPDLEEKPGVIVDIGAHIGTFSLLAIINAKANKVYALEPFDESYKLLQKNVECNGLSGQVIPFNLAISNVEGIEKLYLDDENWTHSLTNNANGKYVEVETISLRELFERNNIKYCKLLKLNCEGAEFKIILSIEENYLNRIGMMLILFHEDMVKDMYSSKDLVKFLNERDFWIRIINVNKDKKRGWIIAKNRKYYKLSKKDSFSQLLTKIGL